MFPPFRRIFLTNTPRFTLSDPPFQKRSVYLLDSYAMHIISGRSKIETRLFWGRIVCDQSPLICINNPSLFLHNDHLFGSYSFRLLCPHYHYSWGELSSSSFNSADRSSLFKGRKSQTISLVQCFPSFSNLPPPVVHHECVQNSRYVPLKPSGPAVVQPVTGLLATIYD